MIRSANIRPFMAITLTCALVGCAGNGDKLVVHGSVELKGEALAHALVRFVPKDNPDLGTAQATTDANGNFTIQPDANKNNRLRPGKFIVLISKIVQTDPEGGMGAPTENLVPARYNVQAETPLSADLEFGDNRLAPFQLVAEKK